MFAVVGSRLNSWLGGRCRRRMSGVCVAAGWRRVGPVRGAVPGMPGASGYDVVCGSPDLVRRNIALLRPRQGSAREGGFVQCGRNGNAWICRVRRVGGLLGQCGNRHSQQGANSGDPKLEFHCQSSKSETGVRTHALMLKRRNTGGCKQPGQLLFRLSGLVPGRPLGAILDEAHNKRGRRGENDVGAVECRNSKIS